MTYFKELLTAFERYAYGQSLHTAFTEMLEWMLLPFKRYDVADEQRKALEKYQSHPKVEHLVKLITLIGELSENFRDPLGELFMQAISNGHNGQYFTPEPICDMMAMMQMGDVGNSRKVNDPACGSGRMLLAAAKLNRSSLLYGADLDITCCKMALLNMLLNSLTGEVAHMNTLSNEFYRGFKVDTVLVDGFHMPYYTEFTQPELSYIWLRPLKVQEVKSKFDNPFEPLRSMQPANGVQGSLF
ncbi:N-6 DNA methylase [Mucilaginibacter calamicampi]|uniref:site-specific DNA-methyltransferase (adenine-specific) n=1 Tax=Mucilaginibacter calamicampi TaxID=1302352 RepID=A0ABW2YYI3_9SPHI